MTGPGTGISGKAAPQDWSTLDSVQPAQSDTAPGAEGENGLEQTKPI